MQAMAQPRDGLHGGAWHRGTRLRSCYLRRRRGRGSPPGKNPSSEPARKSKISEKGCRSKLNRGHILHAWRTRWTANVTDVEYVCERESQRGVEEKVANATYDDDGHGVPA